MRGFQPGKAKTKPQRFANGGPVRGKGTGTSDSIPDEVPEGTYIMPADTTQAVGEQNLAAMGADGAQIGMPPEGGDIPVQLSNGEYKMPPEQVHAVGVQALDKIKNATHQPVARGFAPGAQESPEPRMFFADGGVVEEEKKRNSFGDPAAAAANPATQVPSVVMKPPPAAPVPNEPLNALANPATAQQTVDLAGQASQQRGMTAASPPIPAPAPTPTPAPDMAPPVPNNTSPSNVWPNSAIRAREANTPEARAAAADWQKSVSAVPGQSFDAGYEPPKVGATTPPAPPAPMSPELQAMEAQRQSDRAALGSAWNKSLDMGDDALRAVGDVATIVPRGIAGAVDFSVIRPLRAAGLDMGYLSPRWVPDGVDPSSMTPYTDQKRMRQAQAADQAGSPSAAATENAANSGSPANMPPSTPEAAPAEWRQYASSPSAAPAPAPVPEDGSINGYQPVTGLSGVYRRGNEYTDTPGGGVSSTGLPPAVSVGNLNAIGNGGVGAPVAPQIQTQAPRGPQVTTMSGTAFGFRSPAEQERAQLVRNLTTPVQGARGLTAAQRNGMLSLMNQESQAQQAADRNATALQQSQMGNDTQRDIASMRETGENARAGVRNAIDTGRLSLDAGRLGLESELKGFDIRAGQRQEKLYERYAAAKTPDERSAIAQEIRDLSGKATNPRDDLIAVGGGQEWDANAGVMRNVAPRIYNARTQQFVGDGGGQQRVPLAQNPAAMKIVNDTSLSQDQRREQLKAMGYN